MNKNQKKKREIDTLTQRFGINLEAIFIPRSSIISSDPPIIMNPLTSL